MRRNGIANCTARSSDCQWTDHLFFNWEIVQPPSQIRELVFQKHRKTCAYNHYLSSLQTILSTPPPPGLSCASCPSLIIDVSDIQKHFVKPQISHGRNKKRSSTRQLDYANQSEQSLSLFVFATLMVKRKTTFLTSDLRSAPHSSLKSYTFSEDQLKVKHYVFVHLCVCNISEKCEGAYM